MNEEIRISEKTQRNSAARAEVLRRIRSALRDVPASEQPEQVEVQRTYLQQDTASRAEIIELFIDRVTDYKATVRRVSTEELSAAIAQECRAQTIQSLVVPADLPQNWIPEGMTVLSDDPQQPLSLPQLEQSDGVLMGCALGIAQTGTIALDSGALQGRRVLSLLPDYALCVIREEQIVGIVPEAVSQLYNAVQTQRAPITLISGPSATSDIELNRIEGVHGPRKLTVFVVS